MAKEELDAGYNDEVNSSDHSDNEFDGFFNDPWCLYSTIAIGVILFISCVCIGLYFYYRRLSRLAKDLEIVDPNNTEKEIDTKEIDPKGVIKNEEDAPHTPDSASSSRMHINVLA